MTIGLLSSESEQVHKYFQHLENIKRQIIALNMTNVDLKNYQWV